MTGARRRLGALLAVLVAALGLVLGGATAASAHATLEGTDPERGSVVATAPTAVTLTFSEGVSLSTDSVRVLDPQGNAVDDGKPEHVDGRAATARVALRSGLANGTYTVAWRAVSEDSHPVGGAFTFSVGAPSDTSVNAAAVQGAEADDAVALAYGTARTVAYLAFALLAGAAAFVLAVWPGGAAVRGVQRLLMTGWVALLLSTVAVLMLRGPYERGTGLGQSFDLSLVRATLDERIGTALAARLLLLAAAGVFLSLLVGQLGTPQPKPAPAAGTAGTEEPAETEEPADEEEAELRRLERAAAERPQRDARLGLGLAGLALALALAATWVGADHSSVGIQVPLALPMAALHLLAMAGWLGGLAALAVGLRHGLPAAAVDRFSRLAFWLVAVLAVTGVYQSWRGLGSWSALVDTEYGRLLLIKVGCVAAMLGVAWISRAWTARLRTADETAAVTAGAAGIGGAAGAAGAGGGANTAVTAGAGTAADVDGGAVADGETVATGAERAARAAGAAGVAGAAGADAQDRSAAVAGADPERAARAAGAADGAGAGANTAVTAGAGTAAGGAGAAGADAAVAGADPERAAQLARQRAARDRARGERAADGSPARAGLRRSVVVETAVAVLVLVVTTMLTNSPPGRVAQAVAGAPAASTPSAGAPSVPGRTEELKLPYDTGGRTAGAKGTAVVTVNPVATGPNAVTLTLTDSAGQPAEVPELELAFTLPDRDLGPLPVALQAQGTGRWTGTAQLPLNGVWVVSVTVRSSDIDQVTATQQLKVGQ
ncbi:copper resistance CopC/CopD family protein [Kitasatospora phosalacinea]|uniref:copper resistance CopC/CopD family protein n=1 Tax=Kitasatospora phosalacinea TaxID=2065 RepID=UPI0025527804|nr:FixH family protein [Kitasatospora phosalacinea]